MKDCQDILDVLTFIALQRKRASHRVSACASMLRKDGVNHQERCTLGVHQWLSALDQHECRQVEGTMMTCLLYFMFIPPELTRAFATTSIPKTLHQSESLYTVYIEADPRTQIQWWSDLHSSVCRFSNPFHRWPYLNTIVTFNLQPPNCMYYLRAGPHTPQTY